MQVAPQLTSRSRSMLVRSPFEVFMQLADFLDEHTDAILAEWVTFAQRQPGAGRMGLQVLRDHAAEMLRAIAVV